VGVCGGGGGAWGGGARPPAKGFGGVLGPLQLIVPGEHAWSFVRREGLLKHEHCKKFECISVSQSVICLVGQSVAQTTWGHVTQCIGGFILTTCLGWFEKG